MPRVFINGYQLLVEDWAEQNVVGRTNNEAIFKMMKVNN